MEPTTQTPLLTAIVPVSEDGRTFTNLDGVQVTLSDGQAQLLKHYQENWGYTQHHVVRGEMGYTELAMHCRITRRVAIAAFTHPERPYYAAVLLDDGQVHSGCFHKFADGRISLS